MSAFHFRPKRVSPSISLNTLTCGYGLSRHPRGDGDVGLVAVEVEQLAMTTNASSATVWQHHLEMVVHRFGIFA